MIDWYEVSALFVAGYIIGVGIGFGISALKDYLQDKKKLDYHLGEK